MSDEEILHDEDESSGRDAQGASAPPSEIDAPSHEEILRLERENDERVDAAMRRYSRRGFITLGAMGAAGYIGWKWLDTRSRLGDTPWPLRRMLEWNERVAGAYFSSARLSPTFSPRIAARNPRINGHLGLTPAIDVSSWKLRVEGAAGGPVDLTLADVMALPKREMVTELRCIEGWSIIVRWTGARLADLMAKFPPAMRSGAKFDVANLRDLPRYVGMETPGRGYYVGLDMASAVHPQTLLAYAINDAPLSWEHGAPLRLAIPVKYGIKNIKRIGTIRYTDVRPADFWAERGYDWYAGH